MFHIRQGMPNTEMFLSDLERELKLMTPMPMATDEVVGFIRDAVTSKFNAIGKAFAELDYARIGAVSKEDFRGILDKYVMRLDDIQVRLLGISLLLTHITAWMNNYNHYFLYDIITCTRNNFNGSWAQPPLIRRRHGWVITSHCFYVHVITYPHETVLGNQQKIAANYKVIHCFSKQSIFNY